MTQKVLILTPWFAPAKIASLEMAIRLIYLGKARVIENYAETISSPSVTWQVPAVIQLTKPLSGKKVGIKFSKINVFTRDDFSCQYCGARKGLKELNYDHVIPRVQGGKTDFTNIVSACYSCNGKKGGRTPEQAQMKLRKKPVKPTSLPHTPPIFLDREVPEQWKPYLPEGSTLVVQ